MQGALEEPIGTQNKSEFPSFLPQALLLAHHARPHAEHGGERNESATVPDLGGVPSVQMITFKIKC
jgi:hypothetical protein